MRLGVCWCYISWEHSCPATNPYRAPGEEEGLSPKPLFFCLSPVVSDQPVTARALRHTVESRPALLNLPHHPASSPLLLLPVTIPSVSSWLHRSSVHIPSLPPYCCTHHPLCSPFFHFSITLQPSADPDAVSLLLLHFS